MSKMGTATLMCVLFVAPLATLTLISADAQPGRQAATTTLDDSDRSFVLDAAHGGMMEVDLARIALDRATSPEVKQFAQKMIDDHTSTNDELTKLAASKGVTIPTEPNATHKADMESAKAELSKKTGADFDREYMKKQEAAHEKMVKLFEKVAQSGKDADVKAFASKTAPTVKAHWQTAHDWNATMKASKP